VRSFANALMAGNTVVFKTSEYSPKIHTFATQLFVDAGLPAGVLNMVHVAPKDAPAVVERIVAHRDVRKVNFTGSTLVGAKIAEVCGRNIKPVVLELGGKAPVIVMKDANLQAAANSVMFGGLSHSGQVCMACVVVPFYQAPPSPGNGPRGKS
jgi:acyl-CoA reductase-like NAD-dependent aldehyde dehydrogenase